MDSQMFKMCIVSLNKEANRDHQLIEEVVLEVYQQNGESTELIKPFVEADLLRGIKSVKLAFSIYERIPAG